MNNDDKHELPANVFRLKNTSLDRSVERNKLLTVNIGQRNIVGVIFNENHDDDMYVFQRSVFDQRKARLEASTIQFSRKELKERFSHQDLKVLMLKSHINGSCKIGGEFYCECCDYEERCNEEREAAAYSRIPSDADLTEVRAIIESPDYYDGITTTCWKVEEAVVMRLMPCSIASIETRSYT